MNEWIVALIIPVALAVSALVGAPLAAGILSLAARSSDAGDPELTEDADSGTGEPATKTKAQAAQHDDADDDADEKDPDDPATAQPPLRGGMWIGILERLAVTGTLLVGYPAGIAFVIAVKGLGRYPELRGNPSVSERFVIGSLASMLWAVAVGAAGRVLLLL